MQSAVSHPLDCISPLQVYFVSEAEITLAGALRIESPDIVVDDSWCLLVDTFVECLPPKARFALGIQRPIERNSAYYQTTPWVQFLHLSYLVPVWISSLAALTTKSSLSRFNVPN